MLDFRERLRGIAARKQNPDKLNSYVLHEVDLKNAAVDFLENLLDYFASLSSASILLERKIVFELSETPTGTVILGKDKDTQKTVRSKEFEEVREAKIVYNIVMRKLAIAGYSISRKNNQYYYCSVKIKP